MDREFPADAPVTDIADGVYRNGVALVRGHYDPALIADIAGQAVQRYAREDALVREGKLGVNRHRAFELAEVVVGGRPAAELLITDLARFVCGVCIETLTPVPTHAYVRTSTPGEADLVLPFHQDSRIVGLPLINMWIPLSDCGRTIPGLEVVARKLGVLETLPVGTSGNFYAGHGMEIDAKLVLDTYADDLWHPEFKAGDVLIFLGTTVHRSYVTAAMTGSRTSIDLRLIAPRP